MAVEDKTELRTLVGVDGRYKDMVTKLFMSKFGCLQWRHVKHYTKDDFIQRYGQKIAMLEDLIRAWIRDYNLDDQFASPSGEDSKGGNLLNSLSTNAADFSGSKEFRLLPILDLANVGGDSSSGVMTGWRQEQGETFSKKIYLRPHLLQVKKTCEEFIFDNPEGNGFEQGKPLFNIQLGCSSKLVRREARNLGALQDSSTSSQNQSVGAKPELKMKLEMRKLGIVGVYGARKSGHL